MWNFLFGYIIGFLRRFPITQIATGLLLGHRGDVCSSEQCQLTADLLESHLNEQIDPCDNFYEYACGKYAETVSIPSYGFSFTPYDTREQEIDKTIMDYIENTKINDQYFWKIRKFYEVCMDEEVKIESEGYRILQEELNGIRFTLMPPFHTKTRSAKNYVQILARIHRYIFPAKEFLFYTEIGPGVEAQKENVIRIGYTNLPYQLAKEKEVSAENTKYKYEYMAKVVRHLYEYLKFRLTKEQEEILQRRLQSVSDFLKSLDEITTEQYNNDEKIFTYAASNVRNSINELLKSKEIQIDFLEYLQTLYTGYPEIQQKLNNAKDVKVVIAVGKFYRVINLLKMTNAATFESAIWWTLVSSLVEYGPKSLYKYREEYHQQIGYHETPRKVVCIERIKMHFGIFIGDILSKSKNYEEQKDKVTEMFEHIKRAYAESIEMTGWLDESTRRSALKKLNNLVPHIGYKDSLWKTDRAIVEIHDEIKIHKGSYYKTLAGILLSDREKSLQELFTDTKISNKEEVNPTWVSTRYIRRHNYIVVPIAVFGFPFFELGLEVLNYGVLGTMIAREIGNVFFAEGLNYDDEGMNKRWISRQSAAEYERIEKCFKNSYNNIFISTINRNVNGELTLQENMADWPSFKFALRAYGIYVEKYGSEQRLPKFERFIPAKLFTIAFASLNCSKVTTTYLEYQIKTDPHAPAMARVNGVLMNLRRFPAIWKCPSPSPMNPQKKCPIWS